MVDLHQGREQNQDVIDALAYKADKPIGKANSVPTMKRNRCGHVSSAEREGINRPVKEDECNN